MGSESTQSSGSNCIVSVCSIYRYISSISHNDFGIMAFKGKSRRYIRSRQVVTRHPAISFSNSFHSLFNRAGGRTSNVRQKMVIRPYVILVACSLLMGCYSLTDDQQRVLTQARSVGPAPVKRSKLLTTLDLAQEASQRSHGGVRGGRMAFTEIWQHKSGLTITAYDSEYVGNLPIVRNDILVDEVLNKPTWKPTDISPPRKTFEGFYVSSGKKELFSCDENQGEQAMDVNRPSAPQPRINFTSIKR